MKEDMEKFFGDLQYKPLDVLPQTPDFMTANPKIAEDLVRGIMGKIVAKDQLAFRWKCCSWTPTDFREHLHDYVTWSEQENERVSKVGEIQIGKRDS